MSDGSRKWPALQYCVRRASGELEGARDRSLVRSESWAVYTRRGSVQFRLMTLGLDSGENGLENHSSIVIYDSAQILPTW